mmetsp:Transcript_8510/g.20424  ORF Transcript_8510/g.20424 Transcript_8510/m.20424 type:complete len:371 (+) Transcript_8510:1212-2324(+)
MASPRARAWAGEEGRRRPAGGVPAKGARAAAVGIGEGHQADAGGDLRSGHRRQDGASGANRGRRQPPARAAQRRRSPPQHRMALGWGAGERAPAARGGRGGRCSQQPRQHPPGQHAAQQLAVPADVPDHGGVEGRRGRRHGRRAAARGLGAGRAQCSFAELHGALRGAEARRCGPAGPLRRRRGPPDERGGHSGRRRGNEPRVGLERGFAVRHVLQPSAPVRVHPEQPVVLAAAPGRRSPDGGPQPREGDAEGLRRRSGRPRGHVHQPILPAAAVRPVEQRRQQQQHRCGRVLPGRQRPRSHPAVLVVGQVVFAGPSAPLGGLFVSQHQHHGCVSEYLDRDLCRSAFARARRHTISGEHPFCRARKRLHA